MRLYVSGATDTLSRYGPKNNKFLGSFPVPDSGNNPSSIEALGLSVAADNGAFGEFKPGKFAAMLAEYAEAEVALDWVSCPDVVCNSDETFRRWDKWHRRIETFGFRPALVLQNGMTLCDVNAIDPPAVFVGGDNEFKEGPIARKIVQWAKARGKPAHMGRVNTRRRIEYALRIGCDSCDGSGFSQWPDTRIPLYLRWVKQAIGKENHPSFV